MQIQQQSGFIELSETMQHFVSQIADGHTKMASLINRDGMQTRQQIHQSEMRVKNSINAVHVEADVEAKRNRLLQSLKFDSMNVRRTDIKAANEATYLSFFKSLEFEIEPTSGSAATIWADFVDWLQSDDQTFWIQGKPGAGKSTLVKFLLQHESTPKALNKWTHNPLIVSHFFWKPGSVLQRNFKGLLCSLSHQLLFSEPSLIDHILSEFKSFKDSDSIGDWEISHLMAIFKSLLAHYNRPIFFLIDGVDEALEIEEILKFLASSITSRNTKWCISSRGEEIFRQAFSKYKGFKLNEYTRDDMLRFSQKEIQYALSNVQGYENIYTEHFLQRLQHSLVDKAEGVYLWLVLALESIKRGLRNNDREDVILSRLRKLPAGLEELYADMWGRLGEDQDIYQKEAAHYFNLLITLRALTEDYNQIYKDGPLLEWPLTPFQIMLAQDDVLQSAFLDESYELQVSELWKKCFDMTKTISIKTAGLLVIQRERESENTRLDLQIGKKYALLSRCTADKVDFIHRSLFDFLTNTEAGKDILAQAPLDLVSVQLATTVLCQLRLMKSTDETLYKRNRLLRRGGSLHFLRWLLKQTQKNNNFSKEKVFNTLLPAYESLFKAGLIPWDKRQMGCPRPCFDTLILSDPLFQPFIKERLKRRGPSYATRVLREYLCIGEVGFDPLHDLGVNIAEFFHDLGADINSADICFYEPPVSVGQFAGCLTYESALSEFVKLLYSTDTARSGYYEPLRSLLAFLERSPNLNTRTSCLLWSAIDPIDRDNDWNLRQLLSALSAEENKHSRISQDHVVVITEANLKYLVGQFLKTYSSNNSATNALLARALQLAQREGSKPYIKARFIIVMQKTNVVSQTRSVTCYRFVDEDVDVFAEHGKYRAYSPGLEETFPILRMKLEKAHEYIKVCEKVDVSALSALLDQKLGACFRES